MFASSGRTRTLRLHASKRLRNDGNQDIEGDDIDGKCCDNEKCGCHQAPGVYRRIKLAQRQCIAASGGVHGVKGGLGGG